MTKEHLIPLNKRTKEEALKIQKAGGRAKSPAKARAARLNGILSGKKLTPAQAYFYELMQNKEYGKVIDELINLNLYEGHDIDERRDKVIAQLQHYMPKLNVNYDIANKEDIVIDTVFEVLYELKQEKAIAMIKERLEERLKVKT